MDRLKFTPPEIPKGRAGLDVTLGLVNEVLLTNSHIVSRQARLLTPDRVKVESLEVIQEKEEQEKPIDSLILAQVLRMAGVSDDFIRSRAYLATESAPQYFSLDPKQPNFYIGENRLDIFSDPDRVKKYIGVVSLGMLLMQANFHFLIEGGSNLPNRLRAAVKPSFVRDFGDNLLADIQRQNNNVRKEDLEVATEELERIIEPDEGPGKARFLRFGGRIFLVRPSQFVSRPEYGIGTSFDTNVYIYLTTRYRQEFINLIEKRYLVAHRTPVGEVYKRADAVKSILARISLLDRDELMEAYLNSSLPVILLDKYSQIGLRGYPE